MQGTTVILHNPTEAPVRDFPIETPDKKQVHTWSIGPGETLEFPEYVAEVLLQVYNFLQKVMTREERDRELAEQKKKAKGQHFSQVKIVEGNPSPRPPAHQGFTTDQSKGKSQIPEQQVQQTVPDAPPAPGMVGGVVNDQAPDMPNVQPAPNPESNPVADMAGASQAQPGEAPEANPPGNRVTANDLPQPGNDNVAPPGQVSGQPNNQNTQ